MHKGIGSHQSHQMGKDEWLTPPGLILSLGVFDLDPCSPINRPWDTALKHYTVEDDGLAQEWIGRVWCNPPYGLQARAWLDKLATHGNGIALIFARTETEMFFSTVWERADAVLFLRGRIHFHHVDGTKASGNAGGPSCLVAYGQENVKAIEQSGIPGQLIKLKSQEENNHG